MQQKKIMEKDWHKLIVLIVWGTILTLLFLCSYNYIKQCI